ncbi:MAG: dephospho-CoA kinase [Paramuribaculum sp.]|nr:dephospho-CoA kinase [Paramuribaculum sp.]
MSSDRLIAVTGGIGSGKSIVCRILSAIGYDVYDCDSRAKIIMDSSEEIKARIAGEISNDVISSEGIINRRKLAAIVFSDEMLLNRLNSIVHNAVKDDLCKWREGKQVAFVETAILYQSGLDRCVDEVWEVTAPLEVRVERVCYRNCMPEEDVVKRIVSQDSYVPNELHPRILTIVNDDATALLPEIERLIENQIK